MTVFEEWLLKYSILSYWKTSKYHTCPVQTRFIHLYSHFSTITLLSLHVL